MRQQGADGAAAQGRMALCGNGLQSPWRRPPILGLRSSLALRLADSPSQAPTTGLLQPPLGKLPGYEHLPGQAPFILLDHPDFS